MNQPTPFSRYWQLLLTYLRPQRGRVLLLSALVAGGIALQLINPQLVRRFLDAVETQRSLAELIQTAVLFTGIAIMAQITRLAGAYVGENVAWTATNELRVDLAAHCLRLDLAFHKTHKPGELIERVDGDVNQLANFFSQLVIQLLSNLLLMTGVLALLWLVDWRVGLSVTLIGGSGLLALNWLNRFTVPRWQALRQVEADLFGYLEEWLTGTETIQTSGAGAYVMGRLVRLLRARWRAMQSAMRMNLLVMALPHVVPSLAYVAAYWWGDTLFRGGVFTVGSVYLIFYYIDLLRSPLWDIQRQVQDLQRAAASLNRIVALFAVEPAIHDGPTAVLPTGPLAVQFDHVTFAYEDDQYADSNQLSVNSEQSPDSSPQPPAPSHVLHDVNFTLAPGRVLGLLGRTGSGKSTISRLLFRFYDPTDGAVRLGDEHGRFTDLRHTAQAAIRDRVGMVTQDVQLFHASVRDNLTLFNDAIADADIVAALHKLGLRPWLDALPHGLDTTLDGSSGLSAGQAQLLALGRVFLADPGLVILDEASSRLDPATEQLIERAVDRLLAGRTAIIIAHRLATVQRADEIMVLANGRVVEHGARAALANDPGSRFFALLQTGLEEPAHEPLAADYEGEDKR